MSLVSIGQHFVATRVVHLPKSTETSLITEYDQSGPNHQLLQLCTARTAWPDSDQAVRAVHSFNSWLTLISSNYPCLEHIFMIPKVFEPLKFHCISIFTGMKKFVLEGDKESVVRAYEEILQILFSDDNKYEAGPTLHKHVGARRDICEYMALKDDPKVPTYWKNFNPGSSLTDVLKSLDQTVQPSMKKDHIRVELDSGDPVFKAIENIIQSTWDEQKVGHGKDAVGLDELGYRRIRIKKIHRIENLQLYERYARHRNRTFLKIHRDGRKRCKSIETIPNSWGPVMTCDLLGCPDLRREFFPEINEYFFFHGTSRDVIDAICNTGIDFRVGSQNAMYGAGIYGAESSTKADQYVGMYHYDSIERLLGVAFYGRGRYLGPKV